MNIKKIIVIVSGVIAGITAIALLVINFVASQGWMAQSVYYGCPNSNRVTKLNQRRCRRAIE